MDPIVRHYYTNFDVFRQLLNALVQPITETVKHCRATSSNNRIVKGFAQI